ncbi:Site-specific DNA recombinase [Bradyrhizobium lablabi]|uniref:Site-specific DNA recombinase n=1 Tax=Bradyrhizobium lablabi TaxID=722472 RepID=A0A1M7A3V7_9BRAD|nr:recombinase family protein [Bradyrhizobium lablabi]SHL37404.1 Site-specific DNA recombinase [Bradyrhizobium lablabi]
MQVIDDQSDRSVQHEERTKNDDDSISLRAAQYVRMSTDRQIYSTENQAATIAAFAARRNLTIVRTYVDNARSGLRINNRKGLQDLISDVRDRRADFSFILVYDVTRWGRFQDIDESAYYEFICKQAGIRVLYCAEQFENDDSFVSAIMKNLKRVAAGDFSRELSEKVFAGSCRMVRLGFKQGGSPGYGLQRVLVDQSGSMKCLLVPGERKALQTDRVILRPGRTEEVETVRRVFRSFVLERKSELAIARELNEERILNEFGRPWRMLAVRRLLTCEKYIGSYVYNRKSGKLKGRRLSNPPDIWVRCDNAFEGIIDPAIFRTAGTIVSQRPRRTIRAWRSNQEVLTRLRLLLEQKGRLTHKIINEADGMPCGATYSERFGGLKQAYQLVGYHQGRFKQAEARRETAATVAKLGADLVAGVQGAGVSAAFDQGSSVLTIKDTIKAAIFVARCQRMATGLLRWDIKRPVNRGSHLIIAARMDEANKDALDYFLIPKGKMPGGKISFREKHRPKLNPYRLSTLDALVDAIQRFAVSRGGPLGVRRRSNS